MATLVILDSDGVINETRDTDVGMVGDWVAIPGSIEAISRLKKAGIQVAVCSNNPGIAQGQYSEEDLRSVQDKLQSQLQMRGVAIDGFYYCPHGPEANCLCRKPKPGLLFSLAGDLNADLSAAWLVGDGISDMRAAKMVNAHRALVRTGKGEYVMQNFPEVLDIPVYDDLAHFVREFLKSQRSTNGV